MNNKHNIKCAPLVSILCMTYNHKDYIKQCLDGFIMQKTNFNFVAYVGDDCSTDGTTEIIKEYEQKYPHIIKGIYHASNTGGVGNFFDIVNACKSKYVALCDGDDYWIDEYKLQKQVDFLESYLDYTICSHLCKVVSEISPPLHPMKDIISKEQDITLDMMLNNNHITSNSVMYRWEFNNKSIEEYFPKDIHPGDWYLHLLHAKQGKIKIFPDIMSCYGVHFGGIDSTLSFEKKVLKYGLKMINFFDCVYKNITHSSQEYFKNILISKINSIIDVYIENNKTNELQSIGKKYPKYIAEIFLINNQKLNNESNKLKKKYKKYKKLFKATLIALILAILFIIFNVFIR